MKTSSPTTGERASFGPTRDLEGNTALGEVGLARERCAGATVVSEYEGRPARLLRQGAEQSGKDVKRAGCSRLVEENGMAASLEGRDAGDRRDVVVGCHHFLPRRELLTSLRVGLLDP